MFALMAILIIEFLMAVSPQIFVNETTLKLASKWAKKQGIEIQWKSLRTQVDSLSFFKKDVKILATDLCVTPVGQEGNSQQKACSAGVQIALPVKMSGLIPKLTQVGSIHLDHFQGMRDQASVIAQIQIRVSEDQWEGTISATGTQLLEDFPKVSVSDCKFSLKRKPSPQPPPIKDSSSKIDLFPGEFQMNCPVQGTVAMPPSLSQTLDSSVKGTQKTLTRLGAIIHVNLDTSAFPPTSDTEVRGTLNLRLKPVLTPLVEGGGLVNAKVSGVLAEFPDKWTVDAAFDLNLLLPRFQRGVERLKKTSWAVPAPFHVLDGKIEIGVKGVCQLPEASSLLGTLPLRVSDLRVDAEVNLKTRLSSKTERLNLDGVGRIQGSLESQLFELDGILSDVTLELPHLDWIQPPALTADSRFENKKPDTEETPSSFHYRISVRTPEKGFVKIRSNLAKAEIPVQLNLMITDTRPVQGTVAIQAFPIEWARRKATVEHFDLTLASSVNDSPIDGMVRVNYADYIMKVRILSTLGKPRVILSSDPPLPERQLVAALLFGRPLEGLDPDQSESVGNTRAAFQEGAVGLVSLYALASTPVQSVNYDPLTQAFSAKVRLGEGTSLNLGTAATGQTVGIRKRLTPFWTLETQVGSAMVPGSPGIPGSGGATTRQGGQVASAYLEWAHRY